MSSQHIDQSQLGMIANDSTKKTLIGQQKSDGSQLFKANTKAPMKRLNSSSMRMNSMGGGNAASIVQQAKQELLDQIPRPRIGRGHATVIGGAGLSGTDSMSRKNLVQLEPLTTFSSQDGLLPKIASASQSSQIQQTKAQLYLEELLAKKRIAKEQTLAKERKQAEQIALARTEVAKRNQEQIEVRKLKA